MTIDYRPVHTYTLTNEGQLHRAEGEGVFASWPTAHRARINHGPIHAFPRNSKVTEGKTWAYPTGAQSVREYRIYRWNPDDGSNPRIDTYYVDTGDCGPMVLDALIWIKNNIDPDADLPPLLPRGRVRLLLDEHRRHQYARLHQGDVGHQGRGEDLSAAAHGRW